jgi:Fe-S cluster assembly ATP-binding protein
MFEVTNLSVSAREKQILREVSLKIGDGKKIVLMGPNGSGKSTMCKTLMGDPSYLVTNGSVNLNGKNITNLPPNEKVKEGLFMVFQEPEGVDGLNILRFLRTAYNKRFPDSKDFLEKLNSIISHIDFNRELLTKELNITLSGGEKKKLEVLQLLLFNPKYALIDEFDSGLDIDGVKAISKIINESKSGFLIVTHNPVVFRYLKVDEVNIIKDGRIIASGGVDLIQKIEKDGFLWAEKKN